MTKSRATRGKVLAYQAGITYPAFVDVERDALATVFDEHGFERSARRLRDFDAPRALAAIAARIGPQRRDRLRMTPLAHLDKSKGVVIGFQIDRLVQAREVTQSIPGARLHATKERVTIVPPSGGDLLSDCKALAEEVRLRASRLVSHADIGSVSRSVTYMFEESECLPFIAKGTYVLLEGTSSTDRVVSCLRTIRSRFYDAERRAGLRASAIEVVDTPVNRRAVVDAIVDDWQRSVLALVDRLRADVTEAPRRDLTVDRRREEAEDFIRRIRKLRGFAPEPADRIKQIGNAVAEAYSTNDGRPVAVPTWINEAVRDFSRQAEA